jgi:peroxiredoxin
MYAPISKHFGSQPSEAWLESPQPAFSLFSRACDGLRLRDFGISRNECIEHAEFSDKHGISVRLLSDCDGKLCKKYGVWQTKESHGVKQQGIVRSTFIIDKQGVIPLALYGVSAKGHALDMLRVVKTMD